ncbi:MAG: methyltransferase [Clostridiales bacterium]|nr:methyltransferase [Clostridiales bacterium]
MTDERIKPYIRGGEKAEPLGDGYYIIQKTDGYRFGADAVALAHFAGTEISDKDDVLDLCSGCGIIGIMLAISTGAQVTCAEIDYELAEMSVRSASLNGLNNVTVHNIDARLLGGEQKYDVVVCNPPYYKATSKPSIVAPQANSEISITLSDVISIAKRVLNQNGALYMTHVTSRLDEVMCACRDNGFTVKKVVINPNGKTFMLRAVRGGKPYMTLEIKEY